MSSANDKVGLFGLRTQTFIFMLKLEQLLVLGVWVYSSAVCAHGLVHEQIDNISHQLVHDKNNTTLLIKRGRLYIEDENYPKAQQDFKRALIVNPQSRSAHYYLADVMLRNGDYQFSVDEVKKFIATLNEERGGLTRGYRLLGAAYTGLQQHELAAGAYQYAIQYSEEPRPGFYLDLSTSYQQLRRHQDAIDTLQLGLERLGNLSVLQDKMLMIEVDRKNYTGALEYMHGMIEHGQRLPQLYKQQGDIYTLMQQKNRARNSYQQALSALYKLPMGRQNTEELKKLQRQLQRKLKNS